MDEWWILNNFDASFGEYMAVVKIGVEGIERHALSFEICCKKS